MTIRKFRVHIDPVQQDFPVKPIMLFLVTGEPKKEQQIVFCDVLHGEPYSIVEHHEETCGEKKKDEKDAESPDS